VIFKTFDKLNSLENLLTYELIVKNSIKHISQNLKFGTIKLVEFFRIKSNSCGKIKE